MALPSIHVVIVNWNSGRQLAECLSSFVAVAHDQVTISRITVVDNASNDGSIDSLPAVPVLELIRNTKNRGFAAGCNQGAAHSEADLLLFLNPDTRLMPGALERPAEHLLAQINAGIGIVGIQLVDAAGAVARSCARQPTPAAMIANSIGLDRALPSLFPPMFLAEWPHDETREVDQVMGAFMLVRRPLFESLGGFDERFFVYFEDLDLAIRARVSGARSVYLVTAQAFHRGQGTTASAIGQRTFHFSRSRILFALKHFPWPAAVLVTAATVVVEPVARLVMSLATQRSGTPANVLRATALLWTSLPEIFRTHRLS